MNETFRTPDNRAQFLIAMYNQLMNDINRHIVVVWQSIGALFGTFAIFSLVEKDLISLSVASTLVIIVVVWLIAHVYDSSYWYNRNLAIIANIERQFLDKSDLKNIHYYFGAHRKENKMITHLAIQKWLGVGLGLFIIIYHFYKEVRAKYAEITFETCLPWIAVVIGLVVWWYFAKKTKAKYEEFLRNSPGISVDTSGIDFGEGHPAKLD